MAQLIVRNLEDEVVQALKERAKANSRSAEAEHRAILRATLLGPTSGHTLLGWLEAMPDVGADEDFERVRDLPRDVEL